MNSQVYFVLSLLLYVKLQQSYSWKVVKITWVLGITAAGMAYILIPTCTFTGDQHEAPKMMWLLPFLLRI